MNLRPFRTEDLDAVVELFRAISVAAYGFDDQPREETERWFALPRLDYERDTRLAFDEGRLLGYADVDTEDEGTTWWTDLRVAPDADPAVVIPPLLAWLERRAGSGTVRLWAPTPLAALRAEFEAHGFRRIRGSYRMQIALDGALEEPVLPDGIEIRTLQPGQERLAYEVHQETFEDSWAHTREPYEEWRHYLVETESFDPSLWFLAVERGEVVAVALCRDRGGGGFVGVLGVRRSWRRQGVGRALLLHAFREFARRGFDRVALGVDAESLTGANRLYESVGMRVIRQLDFFEKELRGRR